MENVKKFYDAISNDKAMQDRAAALNKPDEQPDEAAAKAAIVAFAKAEGFSFTEADLEAYAAQAKPLADEAMDTAAGGTAGCGCAGVGGGGGTDEFGEPFVCSCILTGCGMGKYKGTGGCVCTGIGAGASDV